LQKHPGTVENFWLPTTEKETKKLLDHFIKTQFLKFGPYEDAIHNEDVFGFHSTLSPMMNMGLITPRTLVDRIVERGQKNEIPLASIEGYIRQVIGWREFVRGIYDNFSKEMDEQNYWRHHRKMGSSWYDGTTGLQPLDDSIGKAQNFGYTHHIERLMILSNIMLLSEIDPKEVYQWFMEMFVDSADWVMAANVYGMGQMSEGGIFSTKPYVCGSNYILKMSNYKKGDWCETLDGLYWRFIEKNRSFFEQNPRMSMMTRHLDKMDKDKKKRLFKKATDFIENNTSQ
jgi:deoxyribodipyrimidine photolyase-related protein